jgi:predicted TIM-barrel fold metal-dependent hydrolase
MKLQAAISDRVMTRRSLLFASAAGAAWALAASARDAKAEEQSPAKTGYIDAHVHVWTPDTGRYPLASGFTVAGMQPPSFTPEQLFTHCRPCGVERVVLIQMSFYRFDNSYMLDTIRRFPGVFRGVAIVDADAQRPQEQMRELAKERVRGFRITPGNLPADAWLSSAGMESMWKCAADENLAICPLINPEVLPALERMCERHPKTRVVIDHFSRIGMKGPVDESDLTQLCAMARFPRVCVKTSAFYALGAKKAPYDDLGPMIRRLLAAYGAKRLMWASDSPFQVEKGHTYRESIDLVRNRLDFLTDEDRQSLLRGTAEEVFFS